MSHRGPATVRELGRSSKNICLAGEAHLAFTVNFKSKHLVCGGKVVFVLHRDTEVIGHRGRLVGEDILVEFVIRCLPLCPLRSVLTSSSRDEDIPFKLRLADSPHRTFQERTGHYHI